MSFAWTDEAIETLRTLWAEGKSATEICQSIGAVSRSAVIGKLHRLQVYRDGPPVRGTRKPRRTLSTQHRAAYQVAWKRRHREEQRLAREEKPKIKTFVHTTNLQNKRESRKNDPGLIEAPIVIVAPASKNLTLIQLKTKSCRWPTNPEGEQYRFCGHEQIEGRPYCEAHCVVSYVKATQRDVDRIAKRCMGGWTGESKSVVLEV